MPSSSPDCCPSSRAQLLADRAALPGKRLPEALYVHRLAVPLLPPPLRDEVELADRLAGSSASECNVVKLSTLSPAVSLLHYPGFFDEAFPRLTRSLAVDLATGRASSRSYAESDNPPVLHRKEELLPPDHPAVPGFLELTLAAEAAGLFDDPRAIGFAWQWAETLRAHSVRVDGHRLEVAEPAAGRSDEPAATVLRHRTALRRPGLSTPMQALARHGFLDGQSTLFDYGCGHGDDLAALRAKGIGAAGWDPYFAPAETRTEADIVNLGFVLNVIEDPGERAEALRSAYALARKLLVVAVLVGGRTAGERYRLYRDGVLTARGTFQKYFTPPELRLYLEQVTGREPVPISPGICFVFRDDEVEQQFLADRQRGSRTGGLEAWWTRAHPRQPVAPRAPRAPRPPGAPRSSVRLVPGTQRWEAQRELLDAFWRSCLRLGRLPEPDEFPDYPAVRRFGRLERIHGLLCDEYGREHWNAAVAARRADLLVYLALDVFERRRSAGRLPEALRRDLRACFGTVAAARDEATALLFSAGKPEVIRLACRQAAAGGIGFLESEDHALFCAADRAGELPAVLRVYLGCAGQLYGEVQAADVVKIHVHSGKLTLLSCSDFAGSALPVVVERVKINLRRQEIFTFTYRGEDEPPKPFYLKSRLLPAEDPGRAPLVALDETLLQHGLIDEDGRGPSLPDLRAALAARGLQLDGDQIVTVPRESERPGSPEPTAAG